MENIKVSVIMCTKNRNSIMSQAIDSILNQTYKNFELIIIDGGSEDETFNTLEQYAANDNRVKWTHLQLGSYSMALNVALALCTGDYITFIESDDIVIPNKLEYQVEYLNTHPKVDVVGCTTLFNEKFGIANTINSMDHKMISEILKTTNMCETIHFASTMIRKSIIDKIFDGKMQFYKEFYEGHCGDVFLYTLYFNKAKFANINTTIYLYRLGAVENSLTTNIEPKFYNETLKDLSLTKKKKVIVELYKKHIESE